MGRGGHQLGFDPGRVGGVAAPVAGLPGRPEQPVHGRDRAQVDALVQQGGVHAGRRPIPAPLGMHGVQDLLLLGRRQGTRLPAGRQPGPR